MDKIAKASNEQRLLLFTETALQLKSPISMVEKDFWVCWTLGRIFSDEWLSQVLRFRGGTSLSKGYRLIDRFSEDIDITLDKDLVLTDDKSKALLRSKKSYKEHKEEVSDIAAQYIGTVLKDKIEKVLGDVVKIYTDEEYQKISGDKEALKRVDNKNLHVIYQKVASDIYLRPDIFLEIGILSALTPNEPREIMSYVAELNPQLELAPIHVPTIMAKRTFWDKATILHREHFRPATKKDKATDAELPSHTPERYSRHYYDLYQMSRAAVKHEAIADFDLLQEVIAYKNQFYPCGWGHTFDECASGDMKLLPNDNNKDLLAQDYKAMREMIFGDKPSWDTILGFLQKLEDEINNEGKNGKL